MENLFVDEAYVVFLGDLEYCREVNAPAPKTLRLSHSAATSAASLDDLQLIDLQEEIARVAGAQTRLSSCGVR